MSSAPDQPQHLADVLAAARRGAPITDALPPALLPDTPWQAYEVQQALLRTLGTTAGAWKVGAKAPEAPIQGAPLPIDGVLRSPYILQGAGFQPLGLELEIAFVLGRRFEPRADDYPLAEVQASVSAMLATIEIVSSRYAAWPEVAPLAQLADLQNHGALVLGEAVPYDAAFDFAAPAASLRVGDAEVAKSPSGNPAGDPRRLLAWVVNRCRQFGEVVEAGTIVTCGSYSGIHFTREPAAVVGTIAGLPPVRITLA